MITFSEDIAGEGIVLHDLVGSFVKDVKHVLLGVVVVAVHNIASFAYGDHVEARMLSL